MEQPVLGAQTPQQDIMYGSRKSRLHQTESKLSAHMDSEDKRVKELTEGILYDFLPAALNVMLPRCEDPLQELDADRCRAVASAALAVSALMNAPPGFLEFLLCVPWRKLSQLYPKSDSIDKLVSNLQVTDEERRKLVNTRIDSSLMATVLDFLYKQKHADSVPPMLQLTPVNPLQPEDKSDLTVSRETVAAVLDGATPLHCAALRGNPAQVDHLLYCGADPSVRTAAGELPIELVPVCGDRAASAPGRRKCRCMAPNDQEVWECRSRQARNLIARRCFLSFSVGLFSWVRLVFFCLLCMLGQAGCYTSISRPVVERHIDTRRQQKVAAARARAHALVTRMRAEAEAGHVHLVQAKRECMESTAFQRGPPDISQICFTDPTKSPPPPPPQISQIHDINLHLQESGTSSTGEELASEKAFKCFVRSVHALQSLELHGDTVPQVFAELVQAGAAESRDTHVLEDEQADLYSCWAESVLLKFRGCTCPGCAALAIQAVRMAHIQATRLFGKMDRLRQTHADRWRAVGEALARVVYVHICLLLETEAQASPTRSLVWRAEQCLREWDRLEKAGLTQAAGVLDPRHVAALQRWTKTADSDLYLAEALHGQSLPHNKTLQEVVLSAVSFSIDGAPILARPVSSEVVASLEQAITLASLPSPLLAHIARGVVANATAELAAAARLRELVGAKGAALGGGGTAEAVAALTLALHDAEPFRSRLGPELEAAMELHSKWTHRLSAVEKLESSVEEVRAYTAAYPLSFSLESAAATGSRAVSAAVAAASSSPQARAGAGVLSGSGPLTGSGGGGPGAAESAGTASPGATASGAVTEEGGTGASGGGSAGEGTQAPDFAEWERRMKQLELAMNDAKDANVSVTKAKRLHKEMAAVAAAAEASRQLEAVMARRPSGPLQLKLALNKAEAAASALSGLGGAPVPGVADVLSPLMAAARRRLDTERAADALSKAAASYRTLADLARLEAAIYNAKKIGAEELDPESYRTSCELRAHLQEAARARASLEAALRTLQTQLRQEDAEALERVLQDASKWEDLLVADIAKARKSLEHWRNMTVCDAKLGRLLREGATTAVLARAIQEAAATGVKVQHAKRILKLMQALEAVLAATVDGGAAERYALVKAKLDAAEQGGVTGGPLPEAARRNLARLAALTAREALEAALKPHSDWSTAQRISALREALDKAEGVLGQGRVTGDGSSGSAVQTAPSGAGGKGGGGDGSQAQQHQPKLVNGFTTGKTSRRKRSSGGGGGGGGVTYGGESQTKQDDAVGSTPPAAPRQADGSSSVLTNGNSNESMALVAAVDDDILNAVRELARKARQVLEEDQAELTRIERERQEAERARKEAQERERQERLRQEQERQKREKAEAAERERALAEKREKAKAEAKARHHHNAQQHSQQHRGRSATGEQISTIGTGAEKAGSSGKATGGRDGGKAAHSGAAAQATTGGRSSASGARPSAAQRDSQLPASQPGSSQSATSTTGQAKGEPALARAASVPSSTSSWRPTPPAPLTASSIRVFEAAAVKAAANGDYRLPSGGPEKPTAAAMVVHTRGDSLESLGEVVHKLNREVIEALDLDCESGVPDQGVVAMNDGSGGNAGIGGGAGGTSSSAVSASGGAGPCDDVSSACGIAGCFPSLDDGTVGGGGGSSARSCSGAAGTLDSILDRTPSHPTSIMSSIASADDVILQGCAGTGISMSSAPLAASSGTGALGSGICLSSISMGPPGTLSYMSETAPSSLPCRLGAQAATTGVEGGLMSGIQTTVGSTASGGNSSSGAALPPAKPRFGVGDLGGASWGLDSPLLSNTPGTAALFPSIAEFGMLSAAKVDTAAGGTAVSGPPTASGWSAGAGGASAAHGVVFGSGPMGQAGVPMAALPGTGGALDEGGLAGVIAGRPHGAILQPGVTGVGSGGGVLSGPGALGGLGTRAGDPGIPGSCLTHGPLSSPRTTVAMANANVQGLLQVRPLGPGSAPATGLTLAHLQGGNFQGGGGRPSLQLQLQAPQPVLQPQGTAVGNGILARSGFWTPPAYQASMELSPDGTGLAASAGGPGSGSMQLGLPPGSAGVQVMEWQHHQQQGDLQPAGLHVLHIGSSSMPGAAGMGPQILRAAPVGTSVNRICRFYLQGYCRDGERCRFAHTVGGMPNQPANGGASTVPGAVQLLQLGPSTSQNVHPQLLAAGTGFATNVTGAPGAGAGLTAMHVTQSSAVGSFAFGAPGAEAFAPLGTGSLSRSSASSIGEPPRLEHLQPKTHVAQQLRHVAGVVYAGGSGSGGVGVGYPGLPPNGGGFVDRGPLGSSVGGGGGGMLGPHQQSVQLRDSATGATFSAILTVGGNPNGSSQRSAHPQQLVLQLPEDLTFSPPSSASTPSSMSGPGTAQTRR